MARTAITPTLLTQVSTATASTAFLADPAGTATGVGAGNGVSIASGGLWHAKTDAENLAIRIVNGSGAPINVTIKAGTNPLANAGGQGDLVLAIPATSTKWIGALDSARFAQADGSIAIDSATAVTVSAFALQRA